MQTTTIESRRMFRLFDWIGRHAAVVAIGALIVALTPWCSELVTVNLVEELALVEFNGALKVTRQVLPGQVEYP